MSVPTWIQSIGLTMGLIIGAVLVAIALFVVRGGLLNTILWLTGLAAAAVGVVNYLSYGRK